MATLPFRPAYGASLAVTPEVLKAKFGNGYQQRLRDGINNIPEVWDVEFPNMTLVNAKTLVAFFVATGGADTFDWTNPWGDTRKYIVTEWNPSFDEEDQVSVKAKFEWMP